MILSVLASNPLIIQHFNTLANSLSIASQNTCRYTWNTRFIYDYYPDFHGSPHVIYALELVGLAY